MARTMETLHTLTDIMRRMRVPDGAVSKSRLGRLVAMAWREKTGRETVIPYGANADGSGGSHTLTAYPEEFVPQIERMVMEALALDRDELGKKAPLPRAVGREIADKRALRDLTPATGSGFWWDTEQDR